MPAGGAEFEITHTVQLSIADPAYASAVREALARSGPWHLDSVKRPDPTQRCVLVVDEDAFHSLSLPLPHPEQLVLITRKDPQLMAQAWDAGIVSVVSEDDPINTVLLAIMAASLRVAKLAAHTAAGGISPNPGTTAGPIPPPNRSSSTKRCKTQ
jgi:hypothetical protein